MVRLPAESTLNFTLQADLTVIPASTLQRGKNVDPDSFSDDDRPVLKRRPGSRLRERLPQWEIPPRIPLTSSFDSGPQEMVLVDSMNRATPGGRFQSEEVIAD